jgi:hypothetical protein
MPSLPGTGVAAMNGSLIEGQFTGLILATLTLALLMMALGRVMDTLRVARWPHGVLRFVLARLPHGHP